ncbi:MAG TPA: SPOR domain-containing protein [Steroidobacteraceae bacterium]|nr:SPOR domain-containing protein [Steroidobacteraceae bacterium]
MDEQLKARLIGAAILVLIAVLLVPELLSGRKPAVPVERDSGAAPGTRSFTIELGGTSPGPAGEAAMSAGPTGDVEPAESTAAAGSEPDDAPEPATEPAAGPKSQEAAGDSPAAGSDVTAIARPAEDVPRAGEARPAAGAWAVQVGAFGSEKSAKKLADQLRADGFDVFVTATSRGGRTLHRVRVGPVSDRASAERVAARLKERKLPAAVVAND